MKIVIIHLRILIFTIKNFRVLVFIGSFFNEGIGYCIVYDDVIVSVCFSGFVFENIHCIDIETIEGYQGRKLAQKIAHSFVKDCLRMILFHIGTVWN